MKKVEKSWGWEYWFANNEKYCGKLLFVRQDEWSSKGKFHYHKIKDETFFIVEGGLILYYVEDDEFKTIILGMNENFHIPPGMKHRFTAATSVGCRFAEASTTHRDDDSYRVSWNEEKKEWVE
jgi:mannose-6-phosphate isomerase-like protein (cupin superfamily)